VRHAAWLHAVPEKLKGEESKAEQLSRLQALEKKHGAGFEPDMPPVNAAEHLVAYLFEIGPTMPGGMGAAALTHGEILAWCALTGIQLLPWEARCIRRLSVDYLVESRRAEKRECLAPWCEQEVVPLVSATQAAIRALARL